jgi:hypothetical protein
VGAFVQQAHLAGARIGLPSALRKLVTSAQHDVGVTDDLAARPLMSRGGLGARSVAL